MLLMRSRTKILLLALGALLLVQAVPAGRNHQNPPVVQEPPWSSPQVRALAVRACFDCHSNQTRWPWYSNVAPISWLVSRDVSEGRRHLNFSQWNTPQRHAKDAANEVKHGDMPMWIYLPLHADARLSDTEHAQLIDGLTATFGTKGGTDQN